ncbi:MAG: hypothetical protein K2P81_12270 [Bacteriovoracaceae bacterium]|nr:hypothetical protein [Bacteriovoracaceae bacterium]
MYCPTCFQNTLKLRSNGVVKLSFNGKARNTSLFTYNLQKDSGVELAKKLREKIADFLSWYSELKNKTPIKVFEVYSSDCQCTNACKIDLVNTKISVIGVMYSFKEIQHIMNEEGAKYGIEIALTPP